MPDPGELGPTGGAVWSEPAEWQRRRTPEGCVICRRAAPLDVIAETSACWVSAPETAPLAGYVCITSTSHVNEPFELPPSEQSAFWLDAMRVARAVAELLHPVKMNYEIHGNTVPHLHLHLFPRHTDDPYVGGPIDPGRASVRRSADAIDLLRTSIREALNASKGSAANE
jgi:diadenosine tetraphosphate (Ap4A) HIT family hydrolase